MKLKPKNPAYLYAGPALFLIFVIVVFPILYTLYISFTNMNIYHWQKFSFIGLKNYARALFRMDSKFLAIFLRTLLWTGVNLVLQFIIALSAALLLNSPGLGIKGIYKTIFMIPWAVPGYISALIWRNGLFNYHFGLINQVLMQLGMEKVPWLSQDFTAFMACLMVNLWLALPFMILVIDGGMQSIDKTYYEAAKMDGASRFRQIRSITLPFLTPILAPAMTITAFVTFKQFDIVYLMTQQTGSKTGADIHMVITYAFETAFVTNNYGYSSALSVIIFLMITLLTVLTRKSAQGGKLS